MLGSLVRHCHRKQKRAFLADCFHVMCDGTVKHQDFAQRQIEQLVVRVHADMSCHSLDGDPSGIVMLLNAPIGLQHNEADSEIRVSDQALSVDAGLLPGFALAQSREFLLNVQVE